MSLKTSIEEVIVCLIATFFLHLFALLFFDSSLIIYNCLFYCFKFFALLFVLLFVYTGRFGARIRNQDSRNQESR